MLRPPAISLLLIFISTAILYAQDFRKPVIRFSHPILDKINTLVENRKYKGAIDLSLSMAEQMKTQTHWEGYISFMLRAAEIETFEVWKGKGFSGAEIYPDYTRPRKYLQSLKNNAGKLVEEYPYLKANVLFTNAVVYHWLDMPDTAEVLHNQALELRKIIYGEASREVADSYLWRGVLYNWGLQRKDLAEDNYSKARDLQKKFMPNSRYALGSVYYGLANIAMETFHFDEALVLANQYLSLYQDIPYEQGFGKQLIANIYWSQGDFEKSLEYRRQAIDIYEESGFEGDLIMEYSNLSSDLSGLGLYVEAEEALKKAEKILNVSHVRNQYYKKMLFENFGDLYRIMKKYDDAEKYFKKAMNIAVQQYGMGSDEVADIHRMRGQMFMEQNLFERSLEDYQKILNAVIPGFSSIDYHIIPEVQYESPYFKNIIAATFHKGDALLAWFSNNGNIDNLVLALDNYRAAYHQIIIARQTIGDELSKPFLMSNFHKSIENSIVCTRLLYQKTNNRKYIEDVLYFVELTKYLNVLDAFQRAERSNNSGVPVALLFQLKGTKNELNKLQKIQFESEHLYLSSDSIAKLRDYIFDLIQTRRKIMSEISRYSGYKVGNFESLLISMADIQKQLNSDEQILEFFCGSDSIYTISITGKSTAMAAVANDIEMDSLFSSIHHILESKPSYKAVDVRNYSKLTAMIYQKLFQPIIEKNKIILIADGALNLIPVEALVVDHQDDKLAFKDLSYLIYDHEISYAYSSSILFRNVKSERSDIENVLAFSYSGNQIDEGIVRQNQMASLPGTYKELEALSQFKNVTSFSDKDALKRNFFNNAQNSDLIHLGVHGIGDPEVADNSRLIFRSDSLESGDLYAYDIYNLNLNARLVVLSACETGFGKRQTGEGIFSIARAFTYAGCPSVVMSMWRVSDRFTAIIMERFYKSLRDGNLFSASLRESKLKFLEQPDEFSAHPSNWAAFVLNGQDHSLTKKSTPVAIWLVFIALGVVAVYLVVNRKRMV